MNQMDRAKRLLAMTISIGLSLGGPYIPDLRIPRGKPQRGHLVGCHVCGATCGTLYKDGDQRICGECRKKREAEANGQSRGVRVHPEVCRGT